MPLEMPGDVCKSILFDLVADADHGHGPGAPEQGQGVMKGASGLGGVFPADDRIGETEVRVLASKTQDGAAAVDGEFAGVRKRTVDRRGRRGDEQVCGEQVMAQQGGRLRHAGKPCGGVRAGAKHL
ncbi:MULTISPECIES: hypothetical protein [Brevundimonas]|jgi:hypothetical protein|nr:MULTISPECIES: hypothetical protein [Brevundimonas]